MKVSRTVRSGGKGGKLRLLSAQTLPIAIPGCRSFRPLPLLSSYLAKLDGQFLLTRRLFPLPYRFTCKIATGVYGENLSKVVSGTPIQVTRLTTMHQLSQSGNNRNIYCTDLLFQTLTADSLCLNSKQL